MGITRKVMSVSTMGLVDFRSDKERAASNTGKTARAAKKQNKLIAQQTAAIQQQTAAQQQFTAQQYPPQQPQVVPPTTPAGWYPDPQNPAVSRYWDGSAWTPATR